MLCSTMVGACAASFPPPTQRLADTQSLERRARALGGSSFAAQLSLKNTQDQIAQAEKAIAKGDNRHADALLLRATADAELSVAQAHEAISESAHRAARDAVDRRDVERVKAGP
jgi:hypothetical protein